MAKPPASPPSSDIDGVHEDGTGDARISPGAADTAPGAAEQDARAKDAAGAGYAGDAGEGRG